MGATLVERRLRQWMVTPALLGFVASSRVRRRPHGLYRALRAVDRTHESALGIWILSGHRDVSAALRHPDLGSDETKADLSALNMRLLRRGRPAPTAQESVAERDRPFYRMTSKLMLFMDPPDHSRIRGLVSKAFTPKRIEALAPRVGQMVHDRLDRLEAAHHMEVLSELAYPLPARVICELLGVPAEDHPLIMRHAPTLGLALDPGPMRSPAAVDAADRAITELEEYLGGLIDTRRRQPGDDLLSALVAAEAEGERLDRDELLATVILLLIAGHETTANVIGNGLLSLLRNPAQLERLREDTDIERSAVEELLRYEGPVNMTERITSREIDLNGTRIPAGRILVLLLAAADRDADAFERPGRLDLSRDPNPHVAFGGGAHFCLGAALARLEARAALPAMVRRFPGLRLAAPVRHRPSFTIRGLERLDVAW